LTLTRRVRLAFVLGSFELGGAEMMLWKLLSRMDRTRFDPVVIALSSRADGMLARFKASGIECHLLGINASTLLRLARFLSARAPDVVQGWMYYGNLAATLSSAITRSRHAVLWAIRGTLVDAQYTSRSTAFSIWLGGKLSFLPQLIINNSTASARQHEERYGYAASRRLVLPNGFDTDVFRPSDAARSSVRSALGLPADAVLVGLIGRYHPMKQHATFIEAAALVSRRFPDVHYVLAGDRVDASNAELKRTIEQHGIGGHVHLLGRRDDMHAVAASLDVAASSSSSGEGFPNVIGEAMSCGVPCVVTDVGDSSFVVGDTGLSVPAGDVRAFAAGIEALLGSAQRRLELGARARQRVVEHFSLDAVVRAYEDVYMEVHQRARARQA
jgi:glycosyltransferase involved in cell wall biosynthesis